MEALTSINKHEGIWNYNTDCDYHLDIEFTLNEYQETNSSLKNRIF